MRIRDTNIAKAVMANKFLTYKEKLEVVKQLGVVWKYKDKMPTGMDEASPSIQQSFLWCYSPQGHDFWDAINSKIKGN